MFGVNYFWIIPDRKNQSQWLPHFELSQPPKGDGAAKTSEEDIKDRYLGSSHRVGSVPKDVPRGKWEKATTEAEEKQPHNRGPDKQSEVAYKRNATGHELSIAPYW
ncbi:hypothetical protein V6N12_044976 [Hibiscus sabdariffa]|uniref:Uncharacterized protein n=1 Tax=Hibiscus sabdariffa TaxID=183260 RepID=A0ABR2G1Y4_9ROSI